ncbi:hypothetical protein Btru_033218 [Bulinus truncatus]|nr:hypothetical protein Btru_033218 [Bulinus truncatus]
MSSHTGQNSAWKGANTMESLESTSKMKHWIVLSALVFCCLVQAIAGQASCPSRCRACLNGQADCSNRSLTAPPKSYPASTTVINLGGNHLRVLGSRSFDRIDTVEVLQLNGNKLTSLRADSFSSLPNLMSLDLSNNQLTSVAARIFRQHTQLRSLLLNRNKLASLDYLQDAAAIQQLSLNNNRIRSLRENDLAQMSQLHSLDLGNNQISSIHSGAFSRLRNLRILYLNNNPLVRTPQFQFTSEILQLVDFSNCQLTAVPGPFPASVSYLKLENNKINRVHQSDLRNITELQVLGLNDNNLAIVEDGALAHLNNLKEVWLRGNSLVYIPRGLPNSVTRVLMDTNHIQQIEVGLFSNQSRLEYLNVENNAIRSILPNTFKDLQFLNGINFQGNQIEVLENGSFANLGSVSTILLSSNAELRTIEAGAFQNLGNLTRLHLSYISKEEFDLQGNFLLQMLRLQTLDLMGSPGLADDFMAMIDNPSLASRPLQSLTRLDMSYNNLVNVSQRVRNLFPNLQFFILDQNPFKCTRNLKWFKDWMLSSPSVTFYQNEDLKCNSPARLHGRPIRSIGDNEWASNRKRKRQSRKIQAEKKQSKKDKNVKQKGKDKSEKEKSKEKSEKEKTKEKSEKEKTKEKSEKEKTKDKTEKGNKKDRTEKRNNQNKTKQEIGKRGKTGQKNRKL